MNRPNIIVIIADDLGYGDLECYGSELNRTPRLNQMASEGMRFTDFYVGSSVCSPSRAALMTGCYPRRVGLDFGHKFGVLLPGDPVGLSPETLTIPRLLKEAGYATKMIGKWHLGDQPDFLPTRHGFDSYFGLPYSNDMIPEHPENKRFQFPPLPLMRDEKVVESDPNQASLTDRYTAEAIRFLRERAGAKEPFFLYLAHMYVHAPVYAPMKHLEQSRNGPYGAAVQHLDQSTGCILDELKALGLDDNTLVIFTSDNGASREVGSNAPLRGAKASQWEGGWREPCIMRWPGTIPAQSTCTELATTMDLLPTFARLTGAPLPEGLVLDGYDILPLLRGDAGAASPYEAFFYYSKSGDRKLYAVRSGKWKLHLIDHELYDLEADIGESTSVYDAHPDVVSRLSALADACRQELGDPHLGIEGRGCRPPGFVENAKPLTVPDQMDPIIRLMYDLDDVKADMPTASST